MLQHLNGIIPPLTTPFLDQEVSYEKLRSNLTILNKKNLPGYVILGSNGESVFLTREEKIRIISVAREHIPNPRLLIAGTGLDSIKETIMLSNDAANNGADYALIITPSFYKSEMKSSALTNYYTSVADNVKIPVLIYNVPKFTNVNIEIETVANLSEHANIVGIKNSSEDIAQTAQFVKNTHSDFVVLAGTASVLLPCLSEGAKGGVLALANIAPDACVAIKKLYEKNSLNEAESIQKKLIPVNDAVTKAFGVAGLKAAMDMVGLFGGEPRLPLEKLNSKQLKELREILLTADLIE